MFRWTSETVLNLVDRLAHSYYTRKYGALTRSLGRRSMQSDRRRGFIIVQIDGLSYEHLMMAVDAGHLPYVSRLLVTDRVAVAPWQCGIPSTTPAVQAGIMFGDRFDIPGFRWYEKESRRNISAHFPNHVREMRERISARNPGILQGGSSYVNMFDGDADLALFTMSVLHSQRFFESVRGLSLLVVFLLSPFRVFRVIMSALVRYGLTMARRLVSLLQPRVFNALDVVTPLIQAVGDAVFVEVQTFGVMIDIYRCVRSIYANYTGYDEAAHRLGPACPAALSILRDIDRRIHQIDRMRRLYRRRRYDLYILSDHGNSPSVPFRWGAGRTLEQHLHETIGLGAADGRAAGTDVREIETESPIAVDSRSLHDMRYLIGELSALGKSRSRYLRRGLSKLMQSVNRRTRSRVDVSPDFVRRNGVVVRASGSLAHVYFPAVEAPLDLPEVEHLHPHLVDALLDTPGIGAVLGRVGGRTLILGADGGRILIGAGGSSVDGRHPLSVLSEPDDMARQLHRLAQFPHSGDLIVLGAIAS
ncbi:MAG: hypothetical protein GX620_00995, partial [Chloroflexi bacterium]|nr:hypothetical protein [Chloroflexota bacterium]